MLCGKPVACPIEQCLGAGLSCPPVADVGHRQDPHLAAGAAQLGNVVSSYVGVNDNVVGALREKYRKFRRQSAGRVLCQQRMPRFDVGRMLGRQEILFERLLGVSGIGPKLALAVLSGIEPPELMRAIERGDIARLTAIPGVGKKTAERIVLELRDRLPMTAIAQPAGEPASGLALRDDLLSALINLGYHRPLAERAVETVLKRSSEGDFEQHLKQALRELAR